MTEPRVAHRILQTRTLRMHIAEQGEGPLVVLLHGFPESWYSWRHQIPALVAAGHVFVAMQPLFRIDVGKTVFYALDEEEKRILLDRIERDRAQKKKGAPTGAISVTRFKGLGEMNPEQLWETTLDPEARTLLQVRIDDVAEAEDIFSRLMGDAVEPRREFIQQNAKDVRFLDI